VQPLGRKARGARFLHRQFRVRVDVGVQLFQLRKKAIETRQDGIRVTCLLRVHGCHL
jgi:hypothetical protein